MKRFVFITAMIILFSTFSYPAFCNNADIPVKVNGNMINFIDAKPFVNSDSRTMVPIRFVSEALGAAVSWNGATKKVTISQKGKVIEFTIGESRAFVDGQEKALDTAACIRNDRTFVPLRFVSEVLGCVVDWINTKRMILINSNSSIRIYDRLLQTGDYEYVNGKTNLIQLKGSNGAYTVLKAGLTNINGEMIQYDDISILIKNEGYAKEMRQKIRDILCIAYPREYKNVYNLFIATAREELWEHDWLESPYAGFDFKMIENRETGMINYPSQGFMSIGIAMPGYDLFSNKPKYGQGGHMQNPYTAELIKKYDIVYED